jgi:hypothetical protein
MKSVLELARECGALAFRDSGGKLLLCGEAQLTAFAARIRAEAMEEAANISPNGLDITASAMPHEVWSKYSAAIRNLAQQ